MRRRAYWAEHDPYAEHPTGSKLCLRCGQRKFVRGNYSRDRCAADGLQRYCRPCQGEQWQLSQYGVVVPDDACCAICGTTNGPGKRKLGVDHCHATELVRGVLCAACNTAIGLLGEDIGRLQAAMAYLQRTPADHL